MRHFIFAATALWLGGNVQKRIAIELLVILALISVLYFVHRHSEYVDASITSTVLPTNVIEKLIIDPRSHTISIITHTGTTTQYFPPNEKSAVDVNKNGMVTLQTRTWGTEFGFALGTAYSDKLRVGLAVPLLYYKRLELEPIMLVGVSPKVDIHLALALSYNIEGNTSLFAGVQTNLTPMGGIQIRF